MRQLACFLTLLLGNVCTGAVDREIGNPRAMQNEFTTSKFQLEAKNARNDFHSQINQYQEPVRNDSTARGLVVQARGRLPFMLPVMYNLGVITTLLVVLTVLMFKGLTLGVIILILNLNGKGWKHVSPTRPVHIHVHNGSKLPYYIPEWNRMDEDEETNSLDGSYGQMLGPRVFNN